MTEKLPSDLDFSTAAEQSSEEDEAQEGNTLDRQLHSADAVEHSAMHVVDESDEPDLEGLLDALDAAVDPEADAIVDDALDIDSADEADAAAEATHDEAGEPDAEPAEIDPYEEFKLELRMKPGKWYVVHSYAGFEKRVKQNIENRKISMNMEDAIYEVQVLSLIHI